MNRAISNIGLAIMVVLLFAGTAVSGYHGKGKTGYTHKTDKMNMDFKSIDTDSSGTISVEEYKTAFPSSTRKGFDFLDTDNNRTLDTGEWQKFKDMHTGMGSGHHKKSYHGEKYHGDKMGDPGNYNAHFGDMDADGDGQVTSTEFDASFPAGKHKANVFNSIDMDNSDTIDHDEWHQFKDAHGLKHKD